MRSPCRRPNVLGCAIALALLLMPGPALAAGGGGGAGGFGRGGSRSGPDPAKVYEEGISLLVDGECRKAARKFRTVLKATPRNAQANYLRGRALACEEKWKRAVSSFKKAIKYDDRLYAAYQYLGATYVEMGRVEDARAQLAELDAMAAACEGTCPEDLEQARAALRTGLSATTPAEPDPQASRLPVIDGATAKASAYLAAVERIHAGDHVGAIEDLRRMLLAIGPHPDVLNYLGYASRNLGRFDESLAYYRQALAVDPDHRGANEYLGELFVELGDLARARVQLEKLDALCPYGCSEYEDLKRRIDDRVLATR